jgi:hypothetical protein
MLPQSSSKLCASNPLCAYCSGTSTTTQHTQLAQGDVSNIPSPSPLLHNPHTPRSYAVLPSSLPAPVPCSTSPQQCPGYSGCPKGVQRLGSVTRTPAAHIRTGAPSSLTTMPSQWPLFVAGSPKCLQYVSIGSLALSFSPVRISVQQRWADGQGLEEGEGEGQERVERGGQRLRWHIEGQGTRYVTPVRFPCPLCAC